MTQTYNASNDWFDPDIVVVSDDYWGTNSRPFWDEYDVCEFPDGRKIC